MLHRRRQAVLSGPGRLELQEADVPRPGPDDLIVEPDAVGICGTDLELFSGSMAYLSTGFASYPMVPGHEWTGTVTELGDGVRGFSVGDRVVGECSVGCGHCARCRAGTYHLCRARTETGIAGRAGALTTAMAFPSTSAHKLPSTVAAADAVFVEPLAVACRALSRLGTAPGQTTGIVGAGTLGLLCAMAGRATGLDEVRFFETDPVRRDFAMGLGFDAGRPGDRFDAVIEASGTEAGVTVATEACDDGGTVVLLGLTGAESVNVHVDGVVVRDLTLRGSLGSPHTWPQAVALIAAGAVAPSCLVSHEYTLDEVADAYELAAQRRSGVRKIVIRP